jgi:hypothetical protein
MYDAELHHCGGPGGDAGYAPSRPVAVAFCTASLREDTPKALPQLANRWVGILHACLQRGQFYDETTAWQHPDAAAA